ncbi:hypothetical protein ACF05W_00520 [Streptomyces lydicus]|uniref:hypothetical protein n=1 Tax=Streptomyces lydicus TaxID=47763 RepID=UPI0036FE566E
MRGDERPTVSDAASANEHPRGFSARFRQALAPIVVQLTKNPRFVNNPEVVEKALAIYNGTYTP